MSSYRIKRSFSRNTFRHQPPTRQGNEFEALFSNELIAWTKKPGVEIVETNPNENKKFLNTKAYETIPLLSGFRRYMSVDVLHESKGKKYDLIFKKAPTKIKDNLPFQNSEIRRYSLKFNPENQDDKIRSPSNLRSKLAPHEHMRTQSQMMESSKKPVQSIKSSKLADQKRINSLITEILYKKEQGLSIEGNKIQYENAFRISSHPPLTLNQKKPKISSTNPSSFYKTIEPNQN